MSQKFNFDKFIDDICNREKIDHNMTNEDTGRPEEIPQRQYNRLYRELWQNRIKYGEKK